MSNYTNIENLKVYTFEFWEDGYNTLIMSDVENSDVMQWLIDDFKDSITGSTDWWEEEIDDDYYNMDEFTVFAKERWYFIYSPQAEESVYF